MAPSCVVHLAHMEDGVASRGTWKSSRGGLVGNSQGSTTSGTRCCTCVRAIPGIQPRLGDEQDLGSLAEKDLGELASEKLDLIQLCALAAQKTIVILSCTNRSVASRWREGILLPYYTLMRPHLEDCIQFCGLQHKKDVVILQGVQRRPQRSSEGWITSSMETAGIGQPGEVKALGRPYSCLPVVKEGLSVRSG